MSLMHGWYVDPKTTDYCLPCTYPDPSSNDGQTNTEDSNDVIVTLIGKGPKHGTTTRATFSNRRDSVSGGRRRSSGGRNGVVTPYGAQPFAPKEDLINLPSLSEEALLHNLRVRYSEDKIYTSIGDILISVNPFKQLRLYTPQMLEEYLHPPAENTTLAPHVSRVE